MLCFQTLWGQQRQKHEYWIDGDNNIHTVYSDTDELNFTIPNEGLEEGIHTICFRSEAEEEGTWGPVYQFKFYYYNPTTQELQIDSYRRTEDNAYSPIVGYRYFFNSKQTYVALAERDLLEMMDMRFNVPGARELATSMEEGCIYTIDEEQKTITLDRKVPVVFGLQTKNKEGHWSAVVNSQFSLDDQIVQPLQMLDPEKQLTVPKPKTMDFAAIEMHVKESGNYYIVATQPCYVKLYSENHELLRTLSDEVLIHANPIGLDEGTYYAIVYDAQHNDTYTDEQITFNLSSEIPVVQTPAIFFQNGEISITCSTPRARIYYTTDGSTPTSLSTPYTSPFSYSGTNEVMAIAIADGYAMSSVAHYDPNRKSCELPKIAYDGRFFTINTATEGATIYYTTDGSNPSQGSMKYSGKTEMNALGAIKAIAIKQDMNNSDIATLEIPVLFDGHKLQTSMTEKVAQAFDWCTRDEITSIEVEGPIGESDLEELRKLTHLQHLWMDGAMVSALPGKAFSSMNLISFSSPSGSYNVGTHLFDDCKELAALRWNADQPLTQQHMGQVDNPNLLLYVRLRSDAPAAIQNVVVNGTADNILLSDKDGGGNFCCPWPFTTRSISYTHHYGMKSGIGVTQGWETIALPFNVQTITHEEKGLLLPFAATRADEKPFWLCKLGQNGFEPTAEIEANVPYIISMPQNELYADNYNVGGKVTFSAKDLTIPTTEEMWSTKDEYAFVPNYLYRNADDTMMPINLEAYQNYPEGSVFVRGLRGLQPFEAYLLRSATMSKNLIPINVEQLTGIPVMKKTEVPVNIYDLTGKLIRSTKEGQSPTKGLSKGVYIVNGKKIIVE